MPEPLSLTTILPTYNERENIPILIEGILAAVRTPVQVLVVDDNSPDGTWQVVQEIAARDPRVRLLHRTTERGLTSAIWAGIRAADTDAVSWMDCDLAMPPETIPLLAGAAERWGRYRGRLALRARAARTSATASRRAPSR